MSAPTTTRPSTTRSTPATGASPTDAVGAPGSVRRRRSTWLDRAGWYELTATAIMSTTRQIAGLFLATSSAPTTHRGVLWGKEQHTGWPFFHDVFAAYHAKSLSSPNVLVLGDIGSGKSSFIKTWAVLRQLLLGRRVVVIDKKRQQRTGPDGRLVSEGEYALLARALGVGPIRFVLGKGSTGSRINVLDPAISGSSTEGGATQLELLRAVLREALGRDIAPLEGKALHVAHRVAVEEAAATGRIATIVDVVRHLDYPTDASLTHVNPRTTADDLAYWGQEAAAELQRLIETDLAGLIDGETSADISLTGGLTVFDISSLPIDGPAVPIVMAIVNSWLRAVLDSQHDTVPTVFVVEEGWHIVEGTFAQVTQRNQKNARGEALMNVTALQHLSDIDAQSPAISTIKEAGTVVIYRQDKLGDAERCVELFNLPPSCLPTLLELPQGTALVKIGTHKPVLVTHTRSAWEQSLTDTDDAMHSTATVTLGVIPGPTP